MNSPILEYLMSYGIDPAYIMIGLLAVMLILIILYIICFLKRCEKGLGYTPSAYNTPKEDNGGELKAL